MPGPCAIETALAVHWFGADGMKCTYYFMLGPSHHILERRDTGRRLCPHVSPLPRSKSGPCLYPELEY